MAHIAPHVARPLPGGVARLAPAFTMRWPRMNWARLLALAYNLIAWGALIEISRAVLRHIGSIAEF